MSSENEVNLEENKNILSIKKNESKKTLVAHPSIRSRVNSNLNTQPRTSSRLYNRNSSIPNGRISYRMSLINFEDRYSQINLLPGRQSNSSNSEIKISAFLISTLSFKDKIIYCCGILAALLQGCIC